LFRWIGLRSEQQLDPRSSTLELHLEKQFSSFSKAVPFFQISKDFKTFLLFWKKVIFLILGREQSLYELIDEVSKQQSLHCYMVGAGMGTVKI
jgi:hypothetical protein